MQWPVQSTTHSPPPQIIPPECCQIAGPKITLSLCQQTSDLEILTFSWHFIFDTATFRTVDNVKPDIIALGYDQAHQERFIVDGCRKLNLEITVSRLKTPIPETSSSTIEKEYGKDIHGI